jgi:hypothetical protein
LNLTLLELVMSVNATGDCACGAGGGGLFAGTVPLYDLPVRAGEGEGAGVGDGCWQKTAGIALAITKQKNNERSIICV